MNEYYLAVMVGFFFGGLGGILFGLFFGERGRRKDLMWYTQQQQRPNDLGKPAEVVPGEDPEENARRRAEIAAVKEGLRAEALRSGIDASDKDLHEEAMRLVTQLTTELDE